MLQRLDSLAAARRVSPYDLATVATALGDRRRAFAWLDAALAEHAFAGLGLFRLELGHRLDNPASCRVASRAGFAAEGVERSKLRYGDLRFDVETHARLATD